MKESIPTSESQGLTWFQKQFYSWLNPYVWSPSDDAISFSTSTAPLYFDSTADYQAWKAVWATYRQREGQDDQLLKESFVELFKSDYRTAFLLHGVSLQLNTFTPFFLYLLFMAIIDKSEAKTIFTLLVLIVVVRLLRTVLNFLGENRLYTLGQRVYSCMAQAIIDKVTLSSLTGEKEKQEGTEISKLIHLDIEKLLLFQLKKSSVLNNMMCVISNAVIMVMMMKWVGLVGFALLFLNFMLFACAFKLIQINEVDLVARTDDRVKKSMEVFEMIKYIKIGALQNFFYNKLVRLRNIELQSLGKTFKYDLIPVFISLVSFKVVTVILCLLLIASHQPFNTAIMFTIHIIVGNLYFMKIATDASFINEAELSFSSIQQFLNCPQVDRSYIHHDRYRLPQSGESVLKMKGSFFWGKGEGSEGPDQLRDINLSLKRGELVAIVGPYGCGKTSLLRAILGQLNPRPNAQVTLQGSLAYVGQKPWIINSTVKGNILFGEPFDAVRYRKAITGACLQPDLQILEAGDETMIGERGCNLSGGQKQRVSLARALYSNADVLLLDDILSAVDAHVGAFIFFQTLKKELKGKTLVLVTHALTFLPHTDRIFLLQKGQVAAAGTFQQLQNHPTLSQIYSAKPKKEESKPTSLEAQLKEVVKLSADEQDIATYSDMQDFSLYIKRNGNIFVAVLVVSLMANLVLHTLILFWMNKWANSQNYQDGLYVWLYLLMAVLSGLLCMAFARYVQTRDLFRLLHAEMVEALLRSSLQYFQQTHFARIIAVLSSDLRINDRIIAQSFVKLGIFLSAFLSNILLIFIVAALISNYYILIDQLLFVVILGYIGGKFLLASRKFNALQHQAKLPLNSSFDETLDGISTVRAHGKQRYQTAFFLDYLANYCRCNTISNGLTTSTELMTTLFYGLFLITALILLNGAGSSTTYDIVLLASIFRGQEFIINTYGVIIQFLVNLKSLRKCHQITQLQPEQGLDLVTQEELDSSKPSHVSAYPFRSTDIEFRNFSAKYKGRSNNVLDGISLKIKPGEKIGVVGRTGSGKSTLILSLMRSIERAGGAILIGGVDTTAVPLSQLRSSIGVILQEHYLFAGTVRQNLDPMNAHNDQAVERALKNCGIWESISKRGGIGAEVAEKGANLSAGEKQLMNVARALLSPKGIVLMDQATASIDSASDELLQRAMRQEFRSCTVIAIAHRISTVMNSDRILVLESGKVVQFDSPAALQRNPNSLFRKLCEEAGAGNDLSSPVKAGLMKDSSINAGRGAMNQSAAPLLEKPAIRFSYK